MPVRCKRRICNVAYDQSGRTDDVSQCHMLPRFRILDYPLLGKEVSLQETEDAMTSS